jgi:hypothetical protein
MQVECAIFGKAEIGKGGAGQMLQLLIKDLLGKVESSSANSLLSSWLDAHGGVGAVEADAD